MIRLAAIALPLSMLAIASPAAAQDYVQVATGIDYSTGDYGDVENTDFLAVPVTVKVKRGDFDVRVSLPYLDVTGPSDVIPGDGGISGAPDSPVTSRSGIGDLVVAATYSMPIGNATWFDTTGKVKIPTASTSKALGTGTTDFTLQGEVLHSFGPLSAAVRGGRR